MDGLSTDDARLQRLPKAAVAVVHEERQELFEDVTLSRAIRDGLQTKSVRREEVFGALKAGTNK